MADMAERPTRVEICFQITRRQEARSGDVWIALSLNSLRLGTRASTEASLQPIGLTAEAHGVKTLITGTNLQLLAPSAPAGQQSLIASVVFEVTGDMRTESQALFYVPGYPPVNIVWDAESEDDLDTGM